jgi:hypothetical protein
VVVRGSVVRVVVRVVVRRQRGTPSHLRVLVSKCPAGAYSARVARIVHASRLPWLPVPSVTHAPAFVTWQLASHATTRRSEVRSLSQRREGVVTVTGVAAGCGSVRRYNVDPSMTDHT